MILSLRCSWLCHREVRSSLPPLQGKKVAPLGGLGQEILMSLLRMSLGASTPLKDTTSIIPGHRSSVVYVQPHSWCLCHACCQPLITLYQKNRPFTQTRLFFFRWALLYPRLDPNSLCTWDQPWTPGPPAFTSQMLEWQLCSITPDLRNSGDQTQGFMLLGKHSRTETQLQSQTTFLQYRLYGYTFSIFYIL